MKSAERHLASDASTAKSPPDFSVKGTLAVIEAHFTLLLWAILVLALVLRVFAVLAIKQTPYFSFLMMDERVYHDWARQIAAGNYLPAAAYEFPPLPAYLTALIYKLFSPESLYTRILNVVLGTFTCLLVGLSAKLLDRPASGLLAALLAALYKPFIFYSAVPLKTALSVFLCAAIVYSLTSFAARPARFKCAVCGLLIGLALNVRGNYLAFVPAAALTILWVLVKSRQPLKVLAPSLGLFAAGLLVVTAPFAVRNYKVTGDWILTTTQAGFNFYLGNNRYNPTPYSRPVAFAASSPVLQGPQFTIEASRRIGQPLTAAEASWFWTREVFREAAQEPGAFARKFLYKVLAPINWFEACDHYDIGFLSGFMPFFQLPLPTFVLIWPLGFAGMLLETSKYRRGTAMTLLFCTYWLTLALFFTNGRYRLPLLTMLIPFAAVVISRFGSALSSGRWKTLAVYFQLILAATLLQFIPLPGSGDLSPYYNFHGMVLENSGNLTEALKFWEQSAQMNSTASPFANLMLAHRAYRRHNYPKALSCLEKIPDDSFAAAYKYSQLGDLYFQQGNAATAIEAYQRSLAINYGQLEVRNKLLHLQERRDPQAARREEAIIQSLSSYYRGF